MKKEHNLGKEVTAEIDSCPTLPIKRWRCIDLPPFNIAGSGLRFRALLIVWGFGSRSVRSFIYKQILMNSGHFGVQSSVLHRQVQYNALRMLAVAMLRHIQEISRDGLHLRVDKKRPPVGGSMSIQASDTCSREET